MDKCAAMAVVPCVGRLLALRHGGVVVDHKRHEEATNMPITKEQEADILRLYHAERWLVNTIAKQLHIHHSTVKRALERNGIQPQRLHLRRSMADPFIDLIKSTLQKYPRITGRRIWEMARARGYKGGYDHFTDIVARYRQRPIEAFMRLRTLPGEQAQVDWAHFGKFRVGNAERRLIAFVMVLSWSRQIFLRFYPGDSTSYFLDGHVEAFKFFGGVSREILYDNLKSAVLERAGDAIRFNPDLLELSARYRFAPKPVAVARGNEKGRVERAIRYVRTSFFAARKWTDLKDLNDQALAWCSGLAAERRCPEDRAKTVAEAFSEEKERLIELPANHFYARDVLSAKVGKTPYVRFDLNDYSVPPHVVGRAVTIFANLHTVSISHEGNLVAEHPRCFDRGQQLEEGEHIEELVQRKRAAKKHRAFDRLHHAAPSSKTLLEATALRGSSLGVVTRNLIQMLELYGPAELEVAIQEALQCGSSHYSAVLQILEQRRKRKGLQPPVKLTLPAHASALSTGIKPHSLASYDKPWTTQKEKDNG
ncbi:MAG TPA: IS21 family transposase [Oculatellaceae cyanobacterium]